MCDLTHVNSLLMSEGVGKSGFIRKIKILNDLFIIL